MTSSDYRIYSNLYRNMNIKHIDVNYGNCKKEWFPDPVITVDVVTYSILDIPCGSRCRDDVIHHILKTEEKEE